MIVDATPSELDVNCSNTSWQMASYKPMRLSHLQWVNSKLLKSSQYNNQLKKIEY